MNPLAIPKAHGHIALAVWATPRIAALPEGAASARKSARGGGPGVGPLRRVRRTEPGIHAALHAPKRARASRPGRDDDRVNRHVHQAGGAPPNRLSRAVMERASATSSSP